MNNLINADKNPNKSNLHHPGYQRFFLARSGITFEQKKRDRNRKPRRKSLHRCKYSGQYWNCNIKQIVSVLKGSFQTKKMANEKEYVGKEEKEHYQRRSPISFPVLTRTDPRKSTLLRKQILTKPYLWTKNGRVILTFFQKRLTISSFNQ